MTGFGQALSAAKRVAHYVMGRPSTPRGRFGHVDDEKWFWYNTEGYRSDPAVRAILPGMPEPGVQARYIGSSGDTALEEAFQAYRLFKQLYEGCVGPLTPDATILDFGCGWGRTLRFFLKDADPGGLWGSDVDEEVIAVCKQTNKWCQFVTNAVTPPTAFGPGTFDLVYCYSVFSHLSEESHKRWLQEFSRILKPGGLLIATTWHREFIVRCEDVRQGKDPSILPAWRDALAPVFTDTERHLADYDAGRFCYSAYDREQSPWSYRDGVSVYGEACIPRDYVVKNWSAHFALADFVGDRAKCRQNVIAARKKA